MISPFLYACLVDKLRYLSWVLMTSDAAYHIDAILSFHWLDSIHNI